MIRKFEYVEVSGLQDPDAWREVHSRLSRIINSQAPDWKSNFLGVKYIYIKNFEYIYIVGDVDFADLVV